MIRVAVLLFVSVAGAVPPTSTQSQGSAQTIRSDDTSMSGTVHDLSGGVVAGATIVVRNGTKDAQAASGPDGRFTVNAPASTEVVVVVRAPGFAELRQTVPAGAPRTNVDLVLSPASVQEAVTVTATRSERRNGDVPASISMLYREDIKQSPALVADDVLRQIPTFSLFRRTSSL